MSFRDCLITKHRIDNSRSYDKTNTPCASLHPNTLENIICFDRNVMTYKIIHKLCPNSFLEKYKPSSSFSSYNTRNSQNLQIPKHRTERYKKSFHYSALKEWNNTPKDIRELPTINTFKRQLKVYLKSKT